MGKKLLGKIQRVPRFPNGGLDEVKFDFMKKIYASRQKGKGALTLTKFDRECEGQGEK